MNDAISRSAVLDIIKEERRFIESLRETTFDNEDRAHNTGELGCAIRLARKIKDIPALDLAPVVYCKDCIHARPLNLRELMVFDSGCFVCTSQYGAGSSYPEYEMTGRVVFPKGFCSYAHRRTNGR